MEGLAAYNYVQQKAFNNYLAMLQNNYHTEIRWNTSEFWKSRY